MKKKSITAKRSKINPKKSEVGNNEKNQITPKSESNNLPMAIKPRKNQIAITSVDEKESAIKERLPSGKIKTSKIKKNMAWVVFGDSEWRRHNNLPPIFNEQKKDVSKKYEIKISGKNYQLSFNKELQKIICREFLYGDKGNILFRNPVDLAVSKQITKLLDGIPENKWLDTLNHATKKQLKRKQQNKPKSPLKKKGRKPEANLIKATRYCIEKYNPKKETQYKPYIEKAYELYKEDGQTQETFRSRVYNKWAKVRRDYARLGKEIRNAKTIKQYVKEVLKIPRNTSKQTV